MTEKRTDEMEESPYCTGLGAITREKVINRKTMLRDPYVIKRSDFLTKLKYLHAIEAVDIG